MKAKSIQPPCNNCFLRCNDKITEAQRKDIFEQFWKLTDSEKKQFYSKNVLEFPCKNGGLAGRRQLTREYTFKVNNQTYRVCSVFFLSTLDISERRINYFLKAARAKTSSQYGEHRGKHSKNRLNPGRIHEMSSHIESFPAVESHYCRAESKKKFLDPHLNISKMYRLYQQSNSDCPVSSQTYRRAFSKMNLSFHQLKKDQCEICYNGYKGHLTEEKQKEFEAHRRDITVLSTIKQNDLKLIDENTVVAAADMANIFVTPKCEIGSVFYKNRIINFNLTGRILSTPHASFTIWNEAIAGRKGDDIASAHMDFLNFIVKKIPNMKKLIYYTDSCVSQNRNQIASFLQ